MNTVAIITPSYNNIDGLKRLVVSLEQLTWPKEKIKLYICDDGSTDDTVNYFTELDCEIEIEVLKLSKNSGPAKARNLGLDKAKADLILFLDSDLTVAPDLIEKHIACYKQVSVVGVRGENKTFGNEKRNKWQRYLDSSLRGPRKAYAQTGKREVTYKEVNTNNFSIRGSVLNLELRFDEKIIHYGGEDMIFAYELSKQNRGQILYEPKAMIFHEHRGFMATMAKMEEYGKETIHYLLQTYPETYSDLVISRFYKPDGKQEKKFWSRIIVNNFGAFVAHGLWRLLPDVMAFRVLQYIMAWYVLKGYREGLNGNE